MTPKTFMAEMVRQGLQESSRELVFHLSRKKNLCWLTFQSGQRPTFRLEFNSGEKSPKEVTGMLKRVTSELRKSNQGIKIELREFWKIG